MSSISTSADDALSHSALQHHPLSSTLYLLLSYHYLHPTSPFPRSAIPPISLLDIPSTSTPTSKETSGFALEGTSSARTTILLGLRLLPRSHELWREYIKLELGWVEALRRRWSVLGINETSRETVVIDDESLLGGQGAFGTEGEGARRAILGGQLVIHALNSAMEAIPPDEGMGFREELVDLLRIYPSPLRSKCLDVVFSDLERISRSASGTPSAQARLLIITRKLYDRPYDPAVKDEGGIVVSGVELVDELGKIGREIRRSAKDFGGTEWGDIAGSWLAARVEECGDNPELVRSLFAPLSTRLMVRSASIFS